MVLLITLLAALTATPATGAAAARDTATAPATQQEAGNPFTKKPCTIYYYHYNLKGLHIAGGYSLNLPLQVFTEPEAARQGREETPPKFNMSLLPDLSIGFQSQGNAFFLSWKKKFRRPKIQLYFKLWI
jgi:hypothetical protein